MPQIANLRTCGRDPLCTFSKVRRCNQSIFLNLRLGYFPLPSSLAFSGLNIITKFSKIQTNCKKKNAFKFLIQKKIFKCMQDLPKLHRNYSSGAIIWGSLHPTEENILLLRHTDIYNDTPVYASKDFWLKTLMTTNKVKTSKSDVALAGVNCGDRLWVI